MHRALKKVRVVFPHLIAYYTCVHVHYSKTLTTPQVLGNIKIKVVYPHLVKLPCTKLQYYTKNNVQKVKIGKTTSHSLLLLKVSIIYT